MTTKPTDAAIEAARKFMGPFDGMVVELNAPPGEHPFQDEFLAALASYFSAPAESGLSENEKITVAAIRGDLKRGEPPLVSNVEDALAIIDRLSASRTGVGCSDGKIMTGPPKGGDERWRRCSNPECEIKSACSWPNNCGSTTHQGPASSLAIAIQNALGCFECADIEGLPDALNLTSDDKLRDLVERRLLHARTYLEGTGLPALIAQTAAVSNCTCQVGGFDSCPAHGFRARTD